MNISMDWMVPFILVSLVFNFIFVISAILYSVYNDTEKETTEPRVSHPASTLSWDERRNSSLSPQVLVYHNLVRLSITNSQGFQPNKKGFWDYFKCKPGQNEYAISSRKISSIS